MTMNITALPSRYEPLVNTFGEKARLTFISPDEDIESFKRLISAAESARQGKILFLSAESGSGKSTVLHSLEIFLPDKIATVIRLPPQHELAVSEIPSYVSNIPRQLEKFTVINFDGREAPYFNEPEYQTFLGALNILLRSRPDLLIVWPVTDKGFSEKMISLLGRIGGKSAFGISPHYELKGVSKNRFKLVLEKLLQVANWRIEDAAISDTEVEELIDKSPRIGIFLDDLQSLIASRFDIGDMGIEFPTLVIAVSSSEPKIREVSRSLRRADSYYIEASRLLMYTKKSNASEWWSNRSTDHKSALPHVIALFNAQLVSVSASAVVHAVLQSQDEQLKNFVNGVRADKGNAKRIVESSEIYKYLKGEAVDNREYGSNVKDETFESFDRIQCHSEIKHKAINKAIVDLCITAGANLSGVMYEQNLVPGLQTDVIYKDSGQPSTAIEFHHKAASESTQNKLAIYVLEKIKEYAINYGLASR